MEELIKRLERVIATGAPDKDGMHLISAEAVLEVVKKLSELGTNLAEVGTDAISRQQAIEAINRAVTKEAARWSVEELPSAQLDGIPLEWIDKHLEWLDNCDNDFAQLAKVSIKAMVELWKKDRI